MIYIKIFMMNGNHGATVCCRYDLKTIFKLSDVAETECVQHVSEREREREKDRQTEGETERERQRKRELSEACNKLFLLSYMY